MPIQGNSKPRAASALTVLWAEWAHVRQIRDVQSNQRPSKPLRGQGDRRQPAGPSWNVAPTQNVPIVAECLDEGTIGRRLLIAGGA